MARGFAGARFANMNQSLMTAVLDRHLTLEDALDRSTDRVELENMLQKVVRPAA